MIEKLYTDELKKAVADSLNSQTMLMNPRTGTVQSREFWQMDNGPESFVETELVEVKLLNEKWVRVN